MIMRIKSSLFISLCLILLTMSITFYVTCIRSHAFKYNYGRQADRTLGQLEVPAIKDMMSCIDSLHTKPLTTGNVMNIGVNTLEIGKWKEFSVSDLFNVVYGVNLELVNCVETTKSDPDAIAFVSRTESNNGVSAYSFRCIGFSRSSLYAFSSVGFKL